MVRGDEWDVAVTDGVVAEVGPELPAGRREIDARGHLVMPGAVDAHVHLNDPGRAEWEGFDTGTRALAAGGATCAIDMPLNSLPPTLDAASFDAKVAAARGRARVDFALWGGLVPGDRDRMDALAERGVVGFKAFMCPSGVDEFPAADPDTLGRGMERAAALGLPVAVHAEDPGIVEPLAARAMAEGRRSMRDWAASRPVRAELSAVETALSLARDTGCALHVVHVSSPEAVDLIAAARAAGVDVTCEACPHHLVLEEGDAEALGAVAKCAPPLRSPTERAGLWRRLVGRRGGPRRVGPLAGAARDEARRRHVRGVGRDLGRADHPAAPADPRAGPRALGRARRGAGDGAPAARFGLGGKGGLRPGADADLAIVRTDATPGSCGPRTWSTATAILPSSAGG